MANPIQVTAPDGNTYSIVIESGLLSDRERLADEFGLGKRVAVVTNETIAPLHGEALAKRLPNAVLVTVPDGEQYKTMEIVTQLCRDLARAGLDRGSTVIALGGGVIGDTAGFVAASYMRGVRLVQVPTSLLAMVDSSVGGKVGVDLPEGKNLVGAFKQPAAVIIDPDVLGTLPPEEWRNGMGEVIKHGLLADEMLLNPLMHTPNNAAELVARAVQVKVDVVEQDPYEHGVRQHLNLGHTFAHAIERVTEYGWAHGAAVGVGLIAAARLSQHLNLLDTATTEQVETIVAESGLPTHIGDLNPEALWQAMHTDKKWRDGRSRFVLLKGMNQPTIVEDVAQADVISVLESMQTKG